MRQIVISLVAMFASLALLVAGSSLLGTVLSIRLSLEGFSPMSVGLILVFHSIGFVFGTRMGTHVLRRVGQVRAFAAFAAVGCAAALVHPMYVAGWLWALLRVLVGFCAAGLIMVLESWISGRATNATRGALLAVYQIVYFSAAAVGQYLVGTGDPLAYPVYSLVAILVVLSLVPLVLTRSEAPLMGDVDRLTFAALWRLSPSGLMGGFASGVANSAFLTLAPLYAAAMGMAVEGVARYMMFAVLSTMLLQFPLGHLSDIIDRRHVLAALAAVAGMAASVAAAFGAASDWVLYPATGVVFGVVGCIYPISLATVTDYMEEGNPVGASAGLLFAFGLGTCAGPLLGGALMQGLGVHGLFVFLALTLAGLAAFVAVRIRITPPLPADQQGRYVNVAVGLAPSLLSMDPRTDEYRD